jgi:adenylate cyclase
MKRNILIAANYSGDRENLQRILQPEGYDLTYAESAEQVIALAHTLQIDAFIVNVGLLKTNGIDLCGEIRAMEKHRSTPVIILAAVENDLIVEEALAAGADDFINTPCAPLAVRTRVKSSLRRWEESVRLERVRRILTQYLSKRTLEVFENSPLTGTLPPPQERDLAICFTDIRGFTAFSEETEPTRLFSLVSDLLADQVNIIHKFGGYVDKFGGDGVMAVFDGPDMVVQSCLCALSILDSARILDMAGMEEIRRFGIGIHTGRAVVGNIGSPEHLDYSAIGSTVNLAARLCGQAQATSAVVSKAVREAVQGDHRLNFHSERQVSIRGFREAVTVYTLNRP